MKEFDAKKRSLLIIVNIFMSILLIMSTMMTIVLAVFDFTLNIGGNISFEGMPAYERVNEAGEPDENGEYLMFGYYPQTIKADNVTVGSEVQDNGYYLGSDDEFYAKEGEEYFKVEKLKWRILDEQSNGKALIVCDTIIDNETYQHQSNYKFDGFDSYYVIDESGEFITEDNGEKVYANNYKHSNLRSFLNNEFYNSAFGDDEKNLIIKTEVDNSLESTMGEGQKYICENTNDYVFALSLADVNNPEYGFMYTEWDSSTQDPMKAFMVSDYAEAKGCFVIPEEGFEEYKDYIGTGFCWLRSPIQGYYQYGDRACFVGGGEWPTDGLTVSDSGSLAGILPALNIQL